MEFVKNYKSTYSLGLSLFIIITILFPKLIALGFITFLGVVVFGLVKRQLYFKLSTIGILFILFYLSYAIGALFTDHPDIASRYLEYKLSFILIPILFFFVPKFQISLIKPSVALLLSMVVLIIFHLISSGFKYVETGNIQMILSSNFSSLHHPTYFSAYCFMGMALLFYGYKNNWKWFKWRMIIPVFILLTLAQILAMSLAGLFILIGFYAFLVIRWTYIKWRIKGLVTGIVVSVALIFLAMKLLPGLSNQIASAKLHLTEFTHNPYEFVKNKQTYVGGNETRLIMWTAAYLEFKDHPFGVGTGNVDEHLKERLIELGQPAMAEKNYNPHNQYLQTGIEIGVFGLLLLVAIIIIGIIRGIKHKNWLLVFIALSLGFNCLFESMLQRQSGVVFYTFWLCLLAVTEFHSRKKEGEVINSN